MAVVSTNFEISSDNSSQVSLFSTSLKEKESRMRLVYDVSLMISDFILTIWLLKKESRSCRVSFDDCTCVCATFSSSLTAFSSGSIDNTSSCTLVSSLCCSGGF